ncbi:MAG: isochorismate synthase [Ardenticatenaceae bacterium]
MFLNDKDPVAMMSRLSSPNYNHALAAVYDAAVMNSLPVALWRYPNEERYHAVVDFSGEAQSRELDLTTLPAGFVFSPFVNQDEKGMLFIQADFYFGPEGSKRYYSEERAANEALEGRKERNRERFFDTYHSLLAGCHLNSPKWFTPSAGYKSDTALDQATFCQVVDSAIDYLNHSDLEKIVVSRVAEEGLPEEFDPVETLISLGERYSHAFISLVAIPGVGTWMGATPERLLTMENGSLTTVALAGTQAKPATLPLEAVSWGAKEMREQGLVSDYIRAFFRHVGAEWEEEGPRTVSAGNVVHLQTTFHAQVDNGEHLALVNQVFDHLHPTSAVCGMPKEQALDFILKHEMYDRSFYSGFLGPTRLHGLCQLFVNLRCMQLSAEKARLYVGAGITSESHAKAEWSETVLKSQTLLSVLHPTTGLRF